MFLRRLLGAACWLTGVSLTAKVWFDSLAYYGWPSYDVVNVIWNKFGSDEDLMILTALALAVGFFIVGGLMLKSSSPTAALAAVALFAVATWHQWGQDVRIPVRGLWASHGSGHVIRLDALLGPNHKVQWEGTLYQRGTRTLQMLLIPTGLILGVAVLFQQSRCGTEYRPQLDK